MTLGDGISIGAALQYDISASVIAPHLVITVSAAESTVAIFSIKGTVLYLALEDSFERLQRRLLDITDEAPAELKCAVECKNISDGFEDMIDSFMQRYPDTKIVIVDTFQKIRQEIGSNINSYSNDYKELGVLKQIASKHGIAILLVHHLRKQGANDPINTLTGSTGISGSSGTSGSSGITGISGSSGSSCSFLGLPPSLPFLRLASQRLA
mgnify:CR=1 FL=1